MAFYGNVHIRRFGLATLAAILAVLVASGIAVAVSFTASILVTESNGNSYTNLPINVTNNNTYLAANGYSTANMTDVKIIVGGTEYPRMLTDNKTFFVADVGAHSSQTFYFVTDQTPQDFSIIPGYNGYFTIADATNLELSDNGTIEQSGQLDATDVGAFLVYKEKAFTTNVTSTGNVTSTIFYNTGDGTAYPEITTNTTGTTSLAAVVVTYPTYTAGDLLIVIIGSSGAANYSNFNDGDDGFTQLYRTNNALGARLQQSGAWYKVMLGTEGASGTWTQTTVANPTAWQCYRIDINQFIGVPVVAASATGTGTNPNPPNNVSGFGAVDTLWIAVTASTDNQTAAPANFEGLLRGGITNACIASAQRRTSAASENPGTFNVATNEWTANTIAIKGLAIIDVTITTTSNDEVITTTLNHNIIGDGSVETWPVPGFGTSRTTAAQTSTYKVLGNYSANITANDAGGAGISYWYVDIANPLWYRGQTVTLAAYVRASSANNLESGMRIYDGVSTSVSTNFAKDDTFHWVTLTKTFDAASTAFQLSFNPKNNSTADTNDNICIDGIVLIVGNSIADYGNFSISDGTTTVGIWTDNTTSAIDNANDWYIMQDNVFSHLNYMTITIDGNQQARYAPNHYIIGDNLPDRAPDVTDNPGTFVWGSMPAGVAAAFGSMALTESAFVAGADLPPPASLGIIGLGVPEIHRPDTSLTMPGSEIYPVVNTVATLTNIPIQMYWWFIASLLALLALTFAGKYSQSSFLGGAAMVVVMALFCVMGESGAVEGSGGALEWWQPALVIMAVISSSIMEKSGI